MSCSLVNSCFFCFFLWRSLCWWQRWWWQSSSFCEFSSFALPCSSSSYSSPCSIFASKKWIFFWSCKFVRLKIGLLEQKKTKKKFHFLKESIFGLVNWSNYNFGHLRHGNHMAMTKKKKSNLKKKLKLKPSPIFEKRNQNQTKIGPFSKC